MKSLAKMTRIKWTFNVIQAVLETVMIYEPLLRTGTATRFALCMLLNISLPAKK